MTDAASPTASRAAAAQAESAADLTVVVTGAFLTGHPLAIRNASYQELQRAIARGLDPDEWQVGQHEAGGTFQSGGGLNSAVPLVLARRGGSAVTHALAEQLREDLIDERLVDVEVDLYDMGVAVLRATLELSGETGGGDNAVARTFKQRVWLRPGPDGHTPALSEALQVLATATATQYADALCAAAPKSLHHGWLNRVVDADALTPTSRLLWLHPILVARARGDGAARAAALAPPFHTSFAVDGGTFAAGIGWSALAIEPGGDVAAPIRLTGLHWAYYALYMQLDRSLLRVLNDQRWTRDAPLGELEDDAEAVFADHLQIMEARARLDSALTPLGGDELAIWQTISSVQRFDVLLEAVERKLEVLRDVAQRRVEQANAVRARRISDVLGGLTALTTITVAVALISYFLGSRSDALGHTWLRLVVVAAAFALSLAIYWTAFRRAPRRRSHRGGGSRRSPASH